MAQRRAGALQPLASPAQRKCPLELQHRPSGIPRYWRRLDDCAKPLHPLLAAPTLSPYTKAASSEAAAKACSPAMVGLSRRATSRTLDLWGTILSARGIPFRSSALDSVNTGRAGQDAGFALYVPPLLEKAARAELAAVAAEKPSQPLPPEAVRHNAHWVLISLLLLIVWHGVRMGWWGNLGGLSPEVWLHSASADAFRILRRQEWYRLITALTVHADSEHLFANVLFGAPFLVILCRKAGLGAGLLLTVFSGMLGNLFNTLYRPLWHSSIGFSTALFGCVGALSGLLAAEGLRRKDPLARRRAVLLLAAGSGVLALLGAEGAKSDYGAHIFGILAGFLSGGILGLLPPLSHRQEKAAGLLAAFLLCFAWYFAFRSIIQ